MPTPNSITLSLKDNPDLAELLSTKKPGDRIKLTDVEVLIAEKDEERFSGVVESVSGDDMFEEEPKADDSAPSVRVVRDTKEEETNPE